MLFAFFGWRCHASVFVFVIAIIWWHIQECYIGGNQAESSDPLSKEREGGTETEGNDPGIDVIIVLEVPVRFKGVRHL